MPRFAFNLGSAPSEARQERWLHVVLFLFFLYLWAVCAYVICPLPIGSDLVDYMRKIDKWGERLNLIPTFFDDNFYFDDPNVTDNFLLGVPFGLGLPFVVAAKNRATKRVLGIVFGFAAGLELIQLGISAVFYGFPYRSVDIDDVLIVFAGTLFGYGVFRAGAYVYRRLGWVAGARWPVWDHFHAVLGGAAAAEPSNAPPDEERRKDPSSAEGAEPLLGADGQ
jgi:glycopeptide antibiotics resistance protein